MLKMSMIIFRWQQRDAGVPGIDDGKVDMLNMQGYDLVPFDLGSKDFMKKN